MLAFAFCSTGFGARGCTLNRRRMVGDALRQQLDTLFLNCFQLDITSSWGVDGIQNLDQRRSQFFFWIFIIARAHYVQNSLNLQTTCVT